MAQAHLAFLQSNAAHIEQEVFQIEYGDIQYRKFVPVDSSANPWAGEVIWYAEDMRGEARFLGRDANDFPFVDSDRRQHAVRIENLGVGYRYNEWELQQAMMLGQSLTAQKARMVRRATEEKIDEIVFDGNANLGWDGLLNFSAVTPTLAAATGTGNSRSWKAKTGKQIAEDVNNAINDMNRVTRQARIADTVVMDVEAYNYIATQPFTEDADVNVTVLEWIRNHNVYTTQTGNALRIMILRGLETAATASGVAGQGRMIVYQMNPEVLKLHMPMPLRFWPAQQILLTYVVPAAFRLGGLEIRLPQAIRYVDGILPAPT